MPNLVELSDDRRTMTITSSDGRRTAHLRSARPDGFTDEQAFKALDFNFSVDEANQRSVAWRKRIVGGWYFTAVVRVGPRFWWLPKVCLGRVMMVGWRYTAVEWSIQKEGKE